MMNAVYCFFFLQINTLKTRIQHLEYSEQFSERRTKKVIDYISTLE